MNQNIHTQLKKLLTSNPSLKSASSSDIKTFIKQQLPEIKLTKEHSQLVYDILFPEKIHSCENSKFISHSVGYRSCMKNCPCYTARLTDAVTLSKSNISTEQKTRTLVKRKTTVLEKYGVTNVFKLDSVKDQSRHTKLEKYGDPNYRNDDKIKKTNVARYGVDNPLRSDDIQQKIRDTNLERYGVENPLLSPQIVDKVKTSLLAEYGVDNFLKSNTHKKRRDDQFFAALPERIGPSATPLFGRDQFVGVDSVYPWECTDCKTTFEDSFANGKNPRCPRCFPKKYSFFEEEVITSLNLDSTHITKNVRGIIGRKELDIYLPKHKIAIECNGTYWHSELRGKGKLYHVEKTQECEKQGIRLLHIWEHDWVNKAPIIQSILHSVLHKNKKYFARKCQISEISNLVKKKFLSENHLQGDAASSVNLGLYDGINLVAVMTFGKARFTDKADWELVRYVQLTGTNVVGGPSKLFAYFKRVYNPKTIVTYADRSIFSGSMYKILGFAFSHYSPPGYHYFSNKNIFKLHSRVTFQKHKLAALLENFNPDLSEWENMQHNGYDRIWDCGNSVWYFGTTSIDVQ